jgi:hypothetical protein
MSGEVVRVDLDGVLMALEVEEDQAALVSDEDVIARLDAVKGAVEKVGHGVLDAVKSISPSSATVEIGFGLSIESGQLVALFGKGKGEASIKVTMTWAKVPSDPPT